MTVEHRPCESEWDYAMPDNWPRVRNKQLLAESLAVSQDGAEELLSVSHITGITPRSEKKVTMIEAVTLDGYRLVEPGDLVVNMMWAWMGALGVSRYAGIVSPAYSVYRPRPGAAIDTRYYDYLYRSDGYVAEMTRHSRGIHSSRLRIYPTVFLNLQVPHPPLEVQRAIADFLDRETAQIDTLLAKKRTLIERLNEKRSVAPSGNDSSAAPIFAHPPTSAVPCAGVTGIARTSSFSNQPGRPLPVRVSATAGSRLPGPHPMSLRSSS